MVFVQLHFRVISPPTQLNIGRVCHPDFKYLSRRLQSDCLNIVINTIVNFEPIVQEQRGNGPDQFESTISLFNP